MNITEANATIRLLTFFGAVKDRPPSRNYAGMVDDLTMLLQRAGKALQTTINPEIGALCPTGDRPDLVIEAQAANELLESSHEVVAQVVCQLNDSIFNASTGDLDLVVAIYLAGEQAAALRDAYQALRVLLDELHEHAEGAL